MNKFTISAIMLTMWACALTPQPAVVQTNRVEVPQSREICHIQVDETVNLREGPGTSWPADKDGVADGVELEVVGYSGKWRQVVLADGRSGWVHSLYISCEAE